jgi:hypothetical protein
VEALFRTALGALLRNTAASNARYVSSVLYGLAWRGT